MSLRIFLAAMLSVSGEASMSRHFKRSHSMAHREEPAEIPVDGSALSADVKAVKYKSKPVSAPDQGFEGANVAHAHMKTTTGDWGSEYGPNAWWLGKPAFKSGSALSCTSLALTAGLLFMM